MKTERQHPAQLISPPFLVIPIVVREGEPVSVELCLQGYPQPGIQCLHGDLVSKRTKVEIINSKVIVSINNVNAIDSGLYTVFAGNSSGFCKTQFYIEVLGDGIASANVHILRRVDPDEYGIFCTSDDDFTLAPPKASISITIPKGSIPKDKVVTVSCQVFTDLEPFGCLLEEGYNFIAHIAKLEVKGIDEFQTPVTIKAQHCLQPGKCTVKVLSFKDKNNREEIKTFSLDEKYIEVKTRHLGWWSFFSTGTPRSKVLMFMKLMSNMLKMNSLFLTGTKTLEDPERVGKQDVSPNMILCEQFVCNLPRTFSCAQCRSILTELNEDMEVYGKSSRKTITFAVEDIYQSCVYSLPTYIVRVCEGAKEIYGEYRVSFLMESGRDRKETLTLRFHESLEAIQRRQV